MLFFKKAPKYILILTAMLILGNYFITPPSSSILTPSGNLFKSRSLIEERMIEFRSRAKEISNINENKIVVVGYFHNPHVIFEILSSTPSYEAVKIGREDYRIKTGNKEYMVFYVDRDHPKEGVNNILSRFKLDDYVFVSTTFDLKWLKQR